MAISIVGKFVISAVFIQTFSQNFAAREMRAAEEHAHHTLHSSVLVFMLLDTDQSHHMSSDELVTFLRIVTLKFLPWSRARRLLKSATPRPEYDQIIKRKVDEYLAQAIQDTNDGVGAYTKYQ